MDIKQALKRLTEANGVAGHEQLVSDVLIEDLAPLCDQIQRDALGNVIALKRGTDPDAGRIMLAGHIDEIGMVVTQLERGFLHFTGVGGLDQRILPGQEVVVLGQQPLPGLIASRPPHVVPPEERRKPIPLDQLFIDVGLPEDQLQQWVDIGDPVVLRREMKELTHDTVAGKAMDNRASVVAILAALHFLRSVQHRWDVYAVATVQEEVGLKGVMTSTYRIEPDVGIALDVTFGRQPGVREEESVQLNQGCAIGFGPNIHPKLFQRLVDVAQAHEIPHQIEPIPGASGTDAWAMQVTRAGIPTALISIPLRNMHTSVEMLSLRDIERAGRLVALFISELDETFRDHIKWD